MVTADAKGMLAIRKGNWKYIDNTPPVGFPQNRMNQYTNAKPQLYNLADDPGEQNNQNEKQPEITKQLLAELKKIQEAASSR